MVAKESSLAACSLGDRDLQCVLDTTQHTQRKCCSPYGDYQKIMRFLALFFLFKLTLFLLAICTVFLSHTSDMKDYRKLQRVYRKTIHGVYLQKEKKVSRSLDLLCQIFSECLKLLPLMNNIF